MRRAVSTTPIAAPSSARVKPHTEMISYLAKEYAYFHQTQHTPRSKRNPVWSGGFAPFPKNWSRGLEDAAPSIVGAIRRPALGAEAASVVDHTKVLAKSLSSMCVNKELDAEVAQSHGVPDYKLPEFSSMLEKSVVCHVPVTEGFSYRPEVDNALTPAAQFAIRIAAKFFGASSHVDLMNALDQGVTSRFYRQKRIVENGTKSALWDYLVSALDTDSVELHDVVQFIACEDPDYDLRYRNEKMVPRGFFKSPKLVYLDVSNADAYLASIRQHIGDTTLARSIYREFLAAPIRCKEQWAKNDLVVIPVIQGLKEASVFGVSSTKDGVSSTNNSLEFQDVAVVALRDHFRVQEVVKAPSVIAVEEATEEAMENNKESLAPQPAVGRAPPSLTAGHVSKPASTPIVGGAPSSRPSYYVSPATVHRKVDDDLGVVTSARAPKVAEVFAKKVAPVANITQTEPVQAPPAAPEPEKKIGKDATVLSLAQKSLDEGVGEVSMKSLKMAALVHKKYKDKMSSKVREDPEFPMVIAKAMDMVQIRHHQRVQQQLGEAKKSKKDDGKTVVSPHSSKKETGLRSNIIIDLDDLLNEGLDCFAKESKKIAKDALKVTRSTITSAFAPQQRPAVVLPSKSTFTPSAEPTRKKVAPPAPTIKKVSRVVPSAKAFPQGLVSGMFSAVPTPAPLVVAGKAARPQAVATPSQASSAPTTSLEFPKLGRVQLTDPKLSATKAFNDRLHIAREMAAQHRATTPLVREATVWL